MLDGIAEDLPPDIFRQLNGGVILLPEAMEHPESRGNLFVLGRYNYQPMGLGRYIGIYYGSFAALYGKAPRETLARKLKEVLHHELVHHFESLAGDKSLEAKDREDMDRYLGRHT